MIRNPIDIMNAMGALPITLGIIGALFITAILVFLARRGKKGKPKGFTVKEADLEQTDIEKQELPAVRVGTGELPCYVLKKEGELKASTIPTALGYIFIADMSMAQVGTTGPCYLVKEAQNGEVVAYDPRRELYQADRSPQQAYFATHWDIVSEVYKIINPFWQSAPFWVTMIVLILLGLTLLIVGG